MGAVLYDPADGEILFFGLEVPDWVATDWGRGEKEDAQVIGQAELAPILLAKRVWRERLRGRAAVYFVGNNFARDAMIRGYSPVVSSARVIAEAWLEDALGGASSWYDRVPGPSNIADGPSRLKFDEIRRVGGKEVPVDLRTGWHWAVTSAAGLANPFDERTQGGQEKRRCAARGARARVRDDDRIRRPLPRGSTCAEVCDGEHGGLYGGGAGRASPCNSGASGVTRVLKRAGRL